MTRDEISKAELLVRQWKTGSHEAWCPLKRLMEKRLLENTDHIFSCPGPVERILLQNTVLNLFERFLARGIFEFKYRDNFHGFCAHAMRHIWLEITRKRAKE